MRKLAFLLVIILTMASFAENMSHALENMNVAIVIAHENFQDEELSIPLQMLKNNGANVRIASTSLDEAIGVNGYKAKPDIFIADVKAKDYNAVLFVGGSGVKELWDNQDALNIAKDFDNANKPIAAICLAPVILARADIIDNRAITAYRSAIGEIESAGAKYVEKPTVIYENIITANGPDAASEFAKHFIGMIMPPPQIQTND